LCRDKGMTTKQNIERMEFATCKGARPLYPWVRQLHAFSFGGVCMEIEKGFCQCGCGQKTKISKINSARDGLVRGEPLRFIHGHNAKGENNPGWRGRAFYTNARGYRMNGAGKFEHILIAERVLGRVLPPNAVVHHVDHNGTNNSNSNLVICESQGYHLLLHVKERRLNYVCCR